MLELRPVCEHCNKALPPASIEAMICSFECTFCRDCVDGVLANVCPNCGGGFAPRPVRPSRDLKNGHYLGRYPPAQKPTHRPVNVADHARFAADVGGIPPTER